MTTPERDENDDLIKRMLEAFYPSTSLNDADMARVTPFMRDAALVMLERLEQEFKALDGVGPKIMTEGMFRAFARANGLEAKT